MRYASHGGFLLLTLRSVDGGRLAWKQGRCVSHLAIQGRGRAITMRNQVNDETREALEKSHQQLWESRRGMIRGALRTADGVRGARKTMQSVFPPPPAGSSTSATNSRQAVAVTAAAVAVGAMTLRLGGRAALLQLLSLDMVAETGLGGQLEGFLTAADDLGAAKYLIFLLGWVVAKTLMLDALGVALAVASGLLFGGVAQGTAISAACATVASLVGFSLARGILRERVIDQMDRRPALRAIERAVSENGFRSVLTLRLAPVLPIPIGAYNYVYGVTTLPVPEFLAGTFVGSVKPYLLDSFLGVFGKGVIEHATAGGDASAAPDGAEDAFLLLGFGAVALVGTLASQLAGATWAEVEEEARAIEAANAAADADSGSGNGGADNGGSSGDDGWNWLELWGIDSEGLPEWVRTWRQLSGEAQTRIWAVVDEEAAAATAAPAAAASVVGCDASEGDPGASAAPGPFPVREDGEYDWGTAVVESVEFTPVLLKIVAHYSNPE
ncbi:unnamed protein product, partial [Phaeothamnion confervicola]